MATVHISLESIEVATLKEDGRPWDGPGGVRVPPGELAAFFALDLNDQLGQLVQRGDAPVPPDLFVRVFAGDELVLETRNNKSFDPRFEDDDARPVELPEAPTLRIEVWDRDVLFNDLVGITTVPMPSRPGEGVREARLTLPPFGQVRRLVMRIA